MGDKESLIDNLGSLDISAPKTQSLKERMMAVKLSNVSAREWFAKTRERVKPWGEFLNTQRFAVPKSLSPVPSRVMKNIDNFQGNYLFVFLGLVVFCVLTSPMLLIALAACLGACYMISLKNENQKISVMGREVSVVHQYCAVGAMSFPLFWLAGAGSAVFWIIGASFFAIGLHAGFYRTQEELEGFDVDLEEVQMI